MTVTYRNQKFFLQIEGEQIEISNWDLLPLRMFTQFGRTHACFLNTHFGEKEFLIDGDSFPLPSGIGYRIETESCNHTLKEGERLCERSQIEFPDCCGLKRKVATLYVIEEEKGPESEWIHISNRNFNHLDVRIRLKDGGELNCWQQSDGDFWCDMLQIFVTDDKVESYKRINTVK